MKQLTWLRNRPLWRVETDVYIWRYAFLVVHARNDCTAIPSKHIQSPGLLCCRPDDMECAMTWSPWQITHYQWLQAIV